MKFNNLVNETRYAIYDINDKCFIPFQYKQVFIAASSQNKDLNHILTQLNLRAQKQYTLEDIFIIVKRAINKFLEEKNFIKNKKSYSFHVYSKTYPDIKVVLEFHLNEFYDIMSFDDLFTSSKWICYIFTILKSNMQKFKSYDQDMFVENINKNYFNNSLLVE